MSYATLAELKDAIGVADSNDDANLQRALNAASTWIDNYCGRQFTADAADVTRVFEPTDGNTLRVPDLRSITTIKTDTNGNRTYATTLSASDYELWPFTGPPYTEVRIWPLSSYSFDTRRVQIVGKFGYSTTPPDAVKEACLILATRYFKRAEAPFGVLGSTDLGQYTRLSQTDPDVVSLLKPYTLSGASWLLV